MFISKFLPVLIWILGVVLIKTLEATDVVSVDTPDNLDPILSPQSINSNSEPVQLSSLGKIAHIAKKWNFTRNRGGLCSHTHKLTHHHLQQPDHKENIRACTCRRILCPVCGTNGVNYGNLCYLNCAKSHESDLTLAHYGRCSIKK